MSEDTLPAQDITVENNVFRDIRNDYYVTFSAVRDVTIKGNVFEARGREGVENIPGAVFVNGCMNVDISDNFYANDVKQAVVLKNYKELKGTDVKGLFPTDSE